MNQVANTQSPTSHSPANGHLDHIPPHVGDDAPVASTAVAQTRVFEDAGRSQSTQIEQARAIAEVQAAVLVAQKCPRDMDRALIEMRRVCRIAAMADRAFFKFPRGGESVTGSTIHLARELARIWGNISYGVKELARNDAKGESEMLAYAWDLQTNVRPDTGFIVPHIRDTKRGPKPIVEVRDVYENNANMGARRVRECIFAAIPRWFVDEAEDICRQTLEAGDGRPFAEQLKTAVEYLSRVGVTTAMIEKKCGCAMVNLTAMDLANLKITYRSIKSGEITRDEAFPETPAADVDAHLRAKVEKPDNTPPAQGGPAPAATAAAPEPQQAQPADKPLSGEVTPKQIHDLLMKKIVGADSVMKLNAIEIDFGGELTALEDMDKALYDKVQGSIDSKREALNKKK